MLQYGDEWNCNRLCWFAWWLPDGRRRNSRTSAGRLGSRRCFCLFFLDFLLDIILTLLRFLLCTFLSYFFYFLSLPGMHLPILLDWHFRTSSLGRLANICNFFLEWFDCGISCLRLYLLFGFFFLRVLLIFLQVLLLQHFQSFPPFISCLFLLVCFCVATIRLCGFFVFDVAAPRGLFLDLVLGLRVRLLFLKVL